MPALASPPVWSPDDKGIPPPPGYERPASPFSMPVDTSQLSDSARGMIESMGRSEVDSFAGPRPWSEADREMIPPPPDVVKFETDLTEAIHGEASKRRRQDGYGKRTPAEYEAYARDVAKRVGRESSPAFVAAVKPTLDAHDLFLADEVPPEMREAVLNASMDEIARQKKEHPPGWAKRTTIDAYNRLLGVGHSATWLNPAKDEKEWQFEENLRQATLGELANDPTSGFWSRNLQGVVATIPQIGLAATGGPLGIPVVFGVPRGVETAEYAKERGANSVVAALGGAAAGTLETILFTRLAPKLKFFGRGVETESKTIRDAIKAAVAGTGETAATLTAAELQGKLAQELTVRLGGGTPDKDFEDVILETVQNLPSTIVQSALLHAGRSVLEIGNAIYARMKAGGPGPSRTEAEALEIPPEQAKDVPSRRAWFEANRERLLAQRKPVIEEAQPEAKGEVADAQQVEVPGPPDGGGGPRPVLRQEGGDTAEGGQGVLRSRPTEEKEERTVGVSENSSPLGVITSSGVYPGTSKPIPDGVRADAEFFGNSPESQAIREHGLDALDVERQGLVLSRVVRLAYHPEIAKAIVESIPVDVMDMLAGEQVSAESLRHNPAMLPHTLSILHDGPVTGFAKGVIESLAGRSALSSTGPGAKEVGLLPKAGSTELPREGLSATLTDQGQSAHKSILKQARSESNTSGQKDVGQQENLAGTGVVDPGEPLVKGGGFPGEVPPPPEPAAPETAPPVEPPKPTPFSKPPKHPPPAPAEADLRTRAEADLKGSALLQGVEIAEVDQAAKTVRFAREDGLDVPVHYEPTPEEVAALDAAAKRAGRGRPWGAFIWEGKDGVLKNGHIYLNKDARPEDFDHEWAHAFQKLGIIKPEELEAYPGETPQAKREAFVEDFLKWKAEKNRPANGVFQRVLDFIKTLFDARDKMFRDLPKRRLTKPAGEAVARAESAMASLRATMRAAEMTAPGVKPKKRQITEKQRLAADLKQAAADNDLDPAELKGEVERVWKEESRETHQDLLTVWTRLKELYPKDPHRAEDRGVDLAKRMEALDKSLTELARQHPDVFGLDDTAWAERAAEIRKSPKPQEKPGTFIEEVAGRLRREKEQEAAAREREPGVDEGETGGEVDAFAGEDVPFSSAPLPNQTDIFGGKVTPEQAAAAEAKAREEAKAGKKKPPLKKKGRSDDDFDQSKFFQPENQGILFSGRKVDPEMLAEAQGLVGEARAMGVKTFDKFKQMAVEGWGAEAAAHYDAAFREAWEPSKAKAARPKPVVRQPVAPTEDSTSLKMAAVEQARLARGDRALAGDTKMVVPEMVDAARRAIERDPGLPERILAEIAANPKRALDPAEMPVLDLHYRQANNQYEASSRKWREAEAGPEKDAAAVEMQAELDNLRRIEAIASTPGGTGPRSWWGRMGVLMQQEYARDFSLAGIVKRVSDAKGGRPLDPGELAKAEELAKQIEENKATQESQEVLIRALTEQIRGAQEFIESSKVLKWTKKQQKAYRERQQYIAEKEQKRTQAESGQTAPLPESNAPKPAATFEGKWGQASPVFAKAKKARIQQRVSRLAQMIDDAVAGEPTIQMSEGPAEAAKFPPERLAVWAKELQGLYEDGLSSFWEAFGEIRKATGGRADARLGELQAAWDTLQIEPVKVDAGDPQDVRRTAGRIQKLVMKAGVTDARMVAEAVRAELGRSIEGFTFEDAANAILGRGKYAKPTAKSVKSELAAALDSLKADEKSLAEGKKGRKKPLPKRDPNLPEGIGADPYMEMPAEGGPEPGPGTRVLGGKFPKSATPEGTGAEQLSQGFELPTAGGGGESADTGGKTWTQEAKIVEDRINATRRRIERLLKQIAEGDVIKEPAKKEDLPYTKEELELRYQEDVLKRRVLEMEAKARWKSYHPIAKALLVFPYTAQTIKAIKASIDWSALGRQGMLLNIGHPIAAARTIGPMLRATLSRRGEFAEAEKLRNRPNYQLHEQLGLDLTASEGGLLHQEETYQGPWAGRIPGVAASERAYITELNVRRADALDAMLLGIEENGRINLEAGKLLANYVNVASGRGYAGKGAFNRAIAGLATVLWSPRLLLSRFQYLAGQPLWSGLWKGWEANKGTWGARKLIALEYARTLASLGVVYGLAQLAGELWQGDDKDKPTVEWDARSSDFSKIKVGDTRIDPMAGLAQATVLMARTIAGEKKTLSGNVKPLGGEGVGYGGQDMWDVWTSFGRTKLSPWLATVIDWKTGRNVSGEEFSAADLPSALVEPLAIRDTREAMQKMGVPAGAAIGLLSFLGIGVQTYEEKTSKSKPRSSPPRLPKPPGPRTR